MESSRAINSAADSILLTLISLIPRSCNAPVLFRTAPYDIYDHVYQAATMKTPQPEAQQLSNVEIGSLPSQPSPVYNAQPKSQMMTMGTFSTTQYSLGVSISKG